MNFHISKIFIHLDVYLDPIHWPAPSWLVSPIARALHRYRRGHGFKSRTGLNFFQVLFTTTRFSSVLSCEDLLSSLNMFTVLCTQYPESLLIQQLLWRMKLKQSSYLITPKPEDNSFTKFWDCANRKYQGVFRGKASWTNFFIQFSILQYTPSSTISLPWPKYQLLALLPVHYWLFQH